MSTKKDEKEVSPGKAKKPSFGERMVMLLEEQTGPLDGDGGKSKKGKPRDP